MSSAISSTWRRRPISVLAAILALPALWLDAAPETAAQTPPTVSLTGQLLVASPSMGDPRFARTVILMVRHDKDGAFGIVVNRLVGERPLAALLETLGEKDTTATGQVRIFAGGPVQPEIGFVVHSTDYQLPTTLDVNARVAMTSSREILRDIGNDKGPQKSLIAFGYAGWAPGQLEGELARRDWVVAPGESKLIFDEDRDKVWDAAFAQRTLDL
jgi:putative transcriptional regulator